MQHSFLSDNCCSLFPATCGRSAELAHSANCMSVYVSEYRWTRYQTKVIWLLPLHCNCRDCVKPLDILLESLGTKCWIFPDRFLGDQRASYNQDLTFKLRIGENGPSPTVEDIVLEGSGLSITQAIFGQLNPLPSTAVSLGYIIL